ncbi:MAG: endonuclease [Methanosphaera sp. rholeuAM74]|nr:MAG: endonuclease [Methanosphaera sp. rholeuAM74]
MLNGCIDKGVYCLIIRVSNECCIGVGAMGRLEFRAGFYVYVGSALNSLSKRVCRHLSSKKKKHWHVDYLLLNKNSKIEQVIYTNCDEKIECSIARRIKEGSLNHIDAFGCSDCNCVSHLYYFDSIADAEKTCSSAYEETGYHAKKWDME